MIDSYARPALQGAFLDPAAKALGRLGLSPLHLTFLALASGLAAAPLLAADRAWPAAAALLLSGLLDALDGSLARQRGEASPAGAALDVVFDRAVEFAVILGLFLQEPSRALACLWMLGAALVCVTSFLVVGIFEKNESAKSFHYSPGLVERAEAFLLFLGMILWPGAFRPLATLFTTLVFFTAALRLAQFCWKRP